MNKDIEPVLDEITAILKKNSMIGLVVVGNPTHCDWRMDIEAPWSCASLEKDAQGHYLLRIRSKAADYPDKEAQHQELQRTVGTFVTLSDILLRLTKNVDQVLVMLANHVEFLGISRKEDG